LKAWLPLREIGKRIFLSFRGAKMDSMPNTLLDLSFIQTTLPSDFYNLPASEDILVHQGFLTAYQSIRSKLRDMLIKTLEEYPLINTIVVIGHSLGGALATLAAIDLRSLNKDIITESQTFGAPHVGNKAFCKLFNSVVSKESKRYMTTLDIVPRLLSSANM
jgi:predicted lipase